MTNSLIANLDPKIISDSPHKGIDCYFIKLDKKWGAKCYQKEHVRDAAYKAQKKAAEYDLGPDVGETFCFGQYYCYITEIVELIWDSAIHNIAEMGYDDYCNFIDDIQDKWADKRDELTSALYDIGIQFEDNHLKNVGLKNGKLVCIDFGEMGW